MKTNPTGFGWVKGVFALTILLLMTGSATAQTETTLPALTGPHKIGRTSLHWKDNARDELETSARSKLDSYEFRHPQSPMRNHSQRSAIIGSVFVARRAGK